MPTTNALFFSLEEAAQEMGLRPIELLWAYAKGCVKGQHIPTADRYVESIRFTSDQIVSAVQSGAIYSAAASHAPFKGHEDDPWPEWFYVSYDKRKFAARLQESVLTPVHQETIQKAFLEANPHIQPFQTTAPDRVNPVTLHVTPEIDLDMLKRPNENTWAPVNTKGVLHSQYETVIAEAIVDHLKALFGRVNNKPYYKTPSKEGGFGGFSLMGSPLVWLCEQLAQGKTVISMIGNMDDFIKSITHGPSRWSSYEKIYSPRDVRVEYSVSSSRIFTANDVRAVIAKLF